MGECITHDPPSVKAGPPLHYRDAADLQVELLESLGSDKGGSPRRFDSYELIRQLGRGTQADVYLCRRWPTESESRAGVPPRFAAVKTYDLRSRRRMSRARPVLAHGYPIVKDETDEPPDHCEEAEKKMYGMHIPSNPNPNPGVVRTTTESNSQCYSLDENEDTKLMMREINILKRVQHRNIPRLLELMVDPDNNLLLAALEYVEGSILTVWDACQEKYISPRTGCVVGPLLAASYTFQLLHALEYLHSCGIAHGDIKPDNILLCRDGKTLKLIDFGMSVIFDQDKSVGLMEYDIPPEMWCFRAPELCVDDKLEHTVASYDVTKVDVWAAAVILYILVLGSPPFFGVNLTKFCKQIKNDELKFPVDDPDAIPLHFGSLMSDGMNKCPEKRIAAHVALRHPFFKCITDYCDEQPDTYRGILFEELSLEKQEKNTTMSSEELCVSQSNPTPAATGFNGNFVESLARLHAIEMAESAQRLDALRDLGLQALKNGDDDD